MNPWIECVPNFSEGRDREVIQRIRQAITSVQDIALLDETADVDHHRCVFTFAGPAPAVRDAFLKAAAVAVETIDLRRHHGVHPRIGALDVAPFIPLGNSSKAEVVKLARRAGKELWERLRVPVYFYGQAALSEPRRKLENIRRGQFEGLLQSLPQDVARLPDVGGPGLHPSAGATAVGVRKFLIACNVDLETSDIAVAKQIARRVRESSGGLPFVKALGLALESRRRAQVSMNLTDFEQTPLLLVLETVHREAQRLGTRVAGGEIIGLVPRKALNKTALQLLGVEGDGKDLILENRLEQIRPRR